PVRRGAGSQGGQAMPSLIAVLGLNGASFKRGLDDAVQKSQKAGHQIADNLSEGLKGFAAGWAGLEGIKHGFESIKQEAEEAHTAILQASRMGIEPEKFAQYDKAAKKFGASGEAL